MRKLIYAFASLVIFNNVQAQTTPTIAVTQWVTGFSSPVGMEHCGDSRLFVVQQRGLIRILNANGNINSTPFLDITSLVSQSGNEMGLLGLAFHPDYANNGYFYVNYTRTISINSRETKISRFTRDPANPDLALANSEFNILTITQPYTNHNGGQIRFGPDGYLYIGMGDGGSADDPDENGQDPLELLGKMLRIDVDGGSPYAIPADNPFFGMTNPKPEIWSLGMRNPWRFSFDRCTGDLWIADVGQDVYEEINVEPAGDAGGRNYGWDCYEANHVFESTGCGQQSTFTFPIYEYSHSNANGCSVTGGHVYRGGVYGGLYGWYLFTDFCSGRVWGTYPNGSGGWTTVVLDDFLTNQYSSFGEDYRGELYLIGRTNGRIYKISEITCLPTAAICGSADIEICQGETADLSAIYGEGNTYQWQLNGGDIDGATSSTYSTTVPGTYTVVVTNGSLCSDESNAVVISLCTSLDELAAGAFNLYPNPAENMLNIEFFVAEKTSVEVAVYTTTGQLVLSENNLFSAGVNKLQTDISALPAGVYVAQLQSIAGKEQKRFVITR